MKQEKKDSYPDDVIFRIAQLFVGEVNGADWETEMAGKKPEDLEKHYADKVAAKVNQEFGLSQKLLLTRESIYPLAREASRRGSLIFIPPIEKKFQADLTKIYPHIADRLHVVRTVGPHDNEKVSAYAARLALTQARRLGNHSRSNESVIGLGLGPGRATRDFCRHFSRLISIEPETPRLDLFAISAAGPAREPQYTSTSFFNMFTEASAKVRHQYGLFAEALVPAKDFSRVKTIAGVKEAFAAREGISMIVSSMGDMDDEHDLLRMFLKESGVKIETQCQQWVGNVQYRPYTAHEPVREKGNELRAVTLFELEDLANWSTRDDKQVILIARQCGKSGCNTTRARALLPLLDHNNRSLRVFSALVMDSATCEDLLKISPKKSKPD